MPESEHLAFEMQKQERRHAAKEHLKGYLAPENQEDLEKVELFDVSKMPEHYQKQLKFLKDERLNDIVVAVVPKELWRKSSQPSESDAAHGMVLFRQDYWNGPDNIAWMTHELAHCSKFKDEPEQYQKDSQTFAFDDLGSKYTYPNNKVEEFTFSRQFEYLKEQGMSKEQIVEGLKEEYDEEDFKLLNRLLERVF
jgi:hypothetical protein